MTRPVTYKSWGVDLEPESIRQMDNACRLPVAAAAALMPDAHVGYGLPIGGILATRGAVVPYAVGVDIACRMRLTVLDIPAGALDKPHERTRLIRSLESQTRFGVGGTFDKRNQHGVMDRDWSVSPVTLHNKDRAWAQLGTSGSGNHFVEYGALTLEARADDLGLDAGVYLALLSHSGSRGPGAAVCQHYSGLARRLHADLPKELSYLAWLELESQPGREYWDAMNLMGHYAAANHEIIHRRIVKDLGAEAVAHVENHHNFAWKEMHDLGEGPEEVIVHRKGATPAGGGALGVIPGSMATPGFVVRGRGSAESLRSASHGAGRVMSRTRAKEMFAWGNVKRDLAAAGVEVLSAGIDEVPGVYKDIHEVMARQSDLVEPIARFDPRIVKMAPAGERPED
ncbi:MAG: RtcB family protein [Phycisphaerales bacterium]|nr:RtcB family protein [Phycisphaerales bacterium]